jgi:hypothetical protein
MAAERSIRIDDDTTPTAPALTGRRQFLRAIGLALLPAAIGISGCTAPKYDRDRGVWVMHPRK